MACVPYRSEVPSLKFHRAINRLDSQASASHGMEDFAMAFACPEEFGGSYLPGLGMDDMERSVDGVLVRVVEDENRHLKLNRE